jgi:hypothetical protein
LNQKIDSGEHIVTILSKNRIVANALWQKLVTLLTRRA